MAGGVAGAVDDLEGRLAQLDGVAVFQPAVGGEGAGGSHAPLGAGGVDLIDPEGVLAMRPLDGNAGLLAQLIRPAAVVGVAVSDPDLLQRQPARGDQGDDLIDLAAGIDHGGLPGPVAPDQGAVLLERRDGRDQGADGRGGGFAHVIADRPGRPPEEEPPAPVTQGAKPGVTVAGVVSACRRLP